MHRNSLRGYTSTILSASEYRGVLTLPVLTKTLFTWKGNRAKYEGCAVQATQSRKEISGSSFPNNHALKLKPAVSIIFKDYLPTENQSIMLNYTYAQYMSYFLIDVFDNL